MLNKRECSRMLIAIFVLLLVALLYQFAFAVITTDEDLMKITDENLMKLDPILKPIIFEYEQSMQTGSPPLFGPMFTAHPSNSDFINTIIKITDNPMAINSAGVKVRSVIGDIVTADVPIRSLSTLIQLPNIVYIQAAHQMKLSSPMLDVSVPETKADQVWKSVPGYTGKGVIVGVVDSGIDWSHPDFMGADGKSRILYLWDQTMPLAPQHPAGYSYGIEWTKAQIDAGQCLEEDVDGHGTHVSSIITGDGRGRDQFTGMAPDANIIFVKSSLLDADIVDAVNYIFNKAAGLNKPVVINMSFGAQTGPHDGTELLDQALSKLLGSPGRAIVAAAGNEGGMPLHVGTSSLRSPSGGDYPWTAVAPLVGEESMAIQIWYKPTDSISVRLLLPKNENGDLADLGVGWVPKGRLRSFTVPSGPLTGAQVIVDATQVASRRLYPNFNNVTIQISDNGDPNIRIDGYIYAIEYDGAGAGFDAYIPSYDTFTTNLPASVSFPNKSFLLAGDGYKTIGTPSSASNIISVASYTTKSEWIDEENRIRLDNQVNIGSVSVFSSLGPLLNDDNKPDIAAPGEYIVAALSSETWARSQLVYRDNEHVAFRGTSMASPHVAGAVALMFQQNPTLTASDVESILTKTAFDMGPAGWDRAWGYGKLDVLAAMDIPSIPHGLEVSPSSGSVTIKWLSNDESDVTGYKIYVSSGNTINAGKVTSYQLNNLTNGTPVTLSVSAYNSSGKEGPRTNDITVIPNPPQKDLTPPNQPKGLSIIPVNTGLSLKWSPNSDYDLAGYDVYYGTSSGNYGKVINMGDTTSYNIGNLTNGVRIYLVITAYDFSGNESARSDEVSAIPQLVSLPGLSYHSGWPIQMDDDVFSSPAIFDVNSDGRMEIAVTTRDGKVSLMSDDGSYMPGWPVTTNGASVSSPAIGDIDGDGKAEIVVGVSEMVYAWHYDGTVLPGWPIKTGDNIVASPAVGDINGDSKNEVVIGSLDGNLYAFNGNGTPVNGWPVSIGSPIFSSVALGDTNGDSKLEVVVGSSNGSVYVYNGDGQKANGWPVSTRAMVGASPAIGDINGDGKLEIVINNINGTVYAWNGDGSAVTGWPFDLQDNVDSDPVIGDIDGDGKLEIVICTVDGLVFVLKSNGVVTDGWPVSVSGIITTSPALADVNGDGNVEVVVSANSSGQAAGLIYAFSSTGKKLEAGWPAYTEGSILNSSPAIDDINGDGNLELVVGSCRLSDGTGGQVYAWDLPSRSTSRSILWGGFRHDSYHTGFNINKTPIAVEESVIPVSFTINVVQDTKSDKYLDISVIASKLLSATPELTVEINGATSSVPFNQIDNYSYKYQTRYTVESSGSYTFTVTGTDKNGNVGKTSKVILIQKTDFSLLQNYPNPFNPETWIPYKLAQPEKVSIEIYNADGQLIRTLNLGNQTAGSYTSKEKAAYWDGKDEYAQEASHGVYFYVLRAGQFKAVKKMIVLK